MSDKPQPSPLTRAATDGALRMLHDNPPSPDTLAGTLRFLCKWRSQVLEQTLVARSGQKVLTGPFQGMDYPVRAAEGSRTTRLLGNYEASLIPVIEGIIARGYDLIVDVGCAEGYYAVGFARRMPKARVLARDISEQAQALCREMVRVNGVGDRVEVGGEFAHGDFALCQGQPSLVLCDIEGAEDELLDPARAPGLLAADILVEAHEGFRPGVVKRIAERFQATHNVTQLNRQVNDSALPDWCEGLSDLDRLLLLWEWRSVPTPWLWMERK
jgi:hypothetical protein